MIVSSISRIPYALATHISFTSKNALEQKSTRHLFIQPDNNADYLGSR